MGELAGGASRARNPKLSDFQDLMSLIKTVVTTMTATLVECRGRPGLSGSGRDQGNPMDGGKQI